MGQGLNQFWSVAAGSIFQVLFPFSFAAYYLRRQDWFEAGLVLFWTGASLISIAVYASDAVTMALPLIGGDAVIHDWH